MKTFPSVLVLILAVILGPGSLHAFAADADGVALGILYDTSGSMRDPVPDAHGAASPKYVIASRALLTVVDQIQAYVTNGAGAPRSVDVGLFVFDKNNAQEVVKVAPFNAAAIQKWARNFSQPAGGTPLGNSLLTVCEAVKKSSQPRKHVIVITDGENTLGSSPTEVMLTMNRRRKADDPTVFVHFIAFDVDAKVFRGVKEQGASVASAANEAQLNSQLDFILQNQILLEKPAKTN